MSEQDVILDAEPTQSAAPVTPEPKAPSLEDRLAALAGGIEQQANATAALALKVGTPSPVPAPVEIDPWANVDPETLDGKKLVQYLEYKATKRAEAAAAERIKALEAQVNSLAAAYQNDQQRAMSDQVATARKKYADFDQHAKDMVELSAAFDRVGKTYDVDALYRMAKAAKGESAAPAKPAAAPRPTPNPSSERPTTSAARPPERLAEPPRGRRGYNDSLRAALSEVSIPT